MKHYHVLVVVLSIAVGAMTAETPQMVVPKMQYTRTALHVSRSLNPDTMQLLQVKTRAGDMTTLIVKKRDGKQQHLLPPSYSREQLNQQTSDGSSAESKSTETNFGDKIGANKSKSEVTQKFVPSPVVVTSNEHHVKPIVHPKPESKPNRRTSNPAARRVYRGQSTANSQESEVRVPAPVYIRSIPMYVKGEREQEVKRSRSLMKIDSDGIPVIQGVRMPDDESDKQVWRNARVINGVLVPYAKGNQTVKKETKVSGTTYLERVPLEKNDDEKVSVDSSLLEKFVPHRFPTDSQSDSRILNFIKTINQREMNRLGNSQPRDSMVRFPHNRRSFDEDTGFQPQTPFHYQKESSERRSFQRSDGSAESSEELQPRMLQYGSPIYPTSLLYTPQSKKPARASFEEGVRTPVLQYAHPELGVQPAKQLQPKTGKASTDASEKIDAATFALFHQDLHSDRSPYVGMETEIDTESSGKRSSDSSTTQMPKNSYQMSSRKETVQNKNLVYDNQNYEFPRKNYYQKHDSYGLGNDDYIKRYPYDSYNSVNRYNSYSGPYLVKVVERPFWERITDTIRDHVHTGMERVSDMTRPVVEPLIEASHKISKNLGFSQRSRGVAQIQEKVGTAVASYPVLLPALGLMAGGAALGLGAVAVGRYLDVGIMRQRSEDDEEDDAMEHKRVLEGVDGSKWIQIENDNGDQGRSIQYGQVLKPQNTDDSEWVVVHEEIDTRNGRKLSDKESKKPAEGEWVLLEETTSEEKSAEPKEVQETKKFEKLVEIKKEDEVPASRKFIPAKSSSVQRRKRETESDFLSDILQSIEPNATPTGLEHLQHHPDWANTPCSKRLFCDIMIQQSDDSILLMEKKMSTFLKLIQPNAAVSYHLGDVMTAVKRHDCSIFKCLDHPKPR